MSFEEAIYFHLSTIAIRLKVFKKIFPPAILQTPLTKLLSYLESSYMYQQKRLLFCYFAILHLKFQQRSSEQRLETDILHSHVPGSYFLLPTIRFIPGWTAHINGFIVK